MQVQLNTQYKPMFQGHGARDINQVMNKLYKTAYANNSFGHIPDVFQVTSRMKDGVEVSGLACFDNGRFTGISFPYELAHYRKEFCKTIIEKYNKVVTKGKYRK